MTRLALIRWNNWAWIGLLLIWIPVALVLVEVLIGNARFIESQFPNLLTKADIILWIAGVGLLLFTAHKIFTLDLIKFNK